MREIFGIDCNGRKASISCATVDEANLFRELLDNENLRSGAWRFVIRTIDLGVDWPVWWSTYEYQRSLYLDALGGAPALMDMDMTDNERRKESWRRYDLCNTLRLATCEEVHYPDVFEVKDLVRPERLDEIRSIFPAESFGRYIMACPPNGRLINPSVPFILDEVWSEHFEFFVEHGLLVQGSDMPMDVVIERSKNTQLREMLKRHGIKPFTRRNQNERLALDIVTKDVNEATLLRESVVARELWCRMAPASLSWAELQAFRWQSRGMAGALFDVYF